MNYINQSKEELINEINILKMQNDSLKQELNLYKENEKIKERFKTDIIGMESILEAVVIFEDVTKLKTVEKSLRDSEAMMKTILENSYDGIYLFDLKTEKYLYLNSSQLKYTGLTKKELNNITVDILYECVHPDDFKIIYEHYKLLTAGIEKFEVFEYRRKVKNGEYHWFSERQKVVRDENGQPIAIVGITRDISERKKYEEKFSNQAEILANVNDAIIALDENERITYCNNALLKLYGLQKQELIGHNIFDLAQNYVDEESIETILFSLEERKKLYSTGDEKHTHEIKCYTKFGNQVVININMTTVRNSNGEFKGLILSIRDVSERYKHQLILEKSEEKYRYLYNLIDECFIIFDVIYDKENRPIDYILDELNPAYEKHTGLLKKNVLGKTAKELNYNDSIWYEVFKEVNLTGESRRFVNKSKILNKWYEVFVFKIDIGIGDKIGILLNDINERVLYTNKLEELIKMQDELYVNVSHELKTPLNVIFSANQVMDMYFKSDSIEDKKDKLFNYHNSIKQNCYRLTKLIDNIVDLSKSNSGLLNLNLVNTNIVDVIENIVQSVSEYVKSKELKVIFDTNIEEKIIACDTYMMERVMLNLISNAIKFSNQNGEIFVNVLDQDGTVEISVKDNGRGIEKQNLDNIFNRFYQEDKSLSRKAEGSGIGLSLIKSLIEMHGGNISVESEVDKGSIFKVELPARTIDSQEFREQTNPMNNKIETIKIEFSDVYSIN